MALSNSVIFAAAQEMFDLVFRRISSELEGDGKLGKSLQILMQFETESAAKADGGILLQQIQFPFNGDIRFDMVGKKSESIQIYVWDE